MNLFDQIWMINCIVLVLLMQAGFICLETGLTRHKNSIHVAMKNISNFGICIIAYWMMGYAIMFGASYQGFFGTSKFFFDFHFPNDKEWVDQILFFMYQMMFAGAAVGIISGAVAERVKFSSYLLISFFFSFIIYPIMGHWVWSGIFLDQAPGWLRKIGFIDFAGSSVVHCTGGWVSLALVLVIGARAGRFVNNDTEGKSVQGSSLPTAILGTIFLWVGWLGFNGGSTLHFNAEVPKVLLCTILAPAAGLVAALFYDRVRAGFFRIESVMNGTLGGLVAITACSNIVSPAASIVIGIGAGILALWTEQLLIRWKIDDPVSAVPVHGFCGAWGILAVAIFGDVNAFEGRSALMQLGIQFIGLCASFFWGFWVTFLIFKGIDRVYNLRVSVEQELNGLNITEHRATSEIVDLYYAMEKQAVTGDLHARLPEEPFTEAGQIAKRYNAVLDRADMENEMSKKLAHLAEIARVETEAAKDQLDEKLNELQQYYKISVGRELKMMKLKKEINIMLETLGEKPKFDLNITEDMETDEGSEESDRS